MITGPVYDPSIAQSAGIGPGQVGVPKYLFKLVYDQDKHRAWAHWVDHINRNSRNAGVLGQADDLEDFLFCTSRQSLLAMGQGLRKIDGAKCFYCAQALTEADVDHFIPFSQYPRDLAHNFVLTHPTCNRSKSGTLAEGPHLERWLQRIGRSAEAIDEAGMAAGILADAQVSRKIAAWGCTAAIARGGSAWLN